MDESVAVTVKEQVSQVILGSRVRMDNILPEAWLAIYEEIFRRHKNELLAIRGRRLVEHIDKQWGGRPLMMSYEDGFGSNTKLVAYHRCLSFLPPSFPLLTDHGRETDKHREGIDIVLLASGEKLILSVVQFEFVLDGKGQALSASTHQFCPSFDQWRELLCYWSHGIGVLHAIKTAIEADLQDVHERTKKLNRLLGKINSYGERVSIC